jgi:hypothetical protein
VKLLDALPARLALRARSLNNAPLNPDGGYVLVWLQQTLRGHSHPAIDAALLHVGLEAMDDPATAETIKARIRTGRPLASSEWIAAAEAAMNRKLGPQKRGPKAQRGNDDVN